MTQSCRSAEITRSLLLLVVLLACERGTETEAPVTPWLAEDFSTYTSTANMLADPRGIYSTSEDVQTQYIVLDQTQGLDIDGYHLTQSMRYSQPDQTANTSGRCNAALSIGRNLVLPSQVPEIWVELYAKFSLGWSSAAPSSWGCSSSAGYKFLFGRVIPGDRFSWGTTGAGGDASGMNGVWDSEYPGAPDNTSIGYGAPNSWRPGDGQWHRYRFHWKPSTTTSSADGVTQVWMDNTLQIDQHGVNMNGFGSPVTALFGLGLGRTNNQGPGADQYIWWGLVKTYNTNPRW